MPVIFNTPTSHRVYMLDKDAAFMLKTMKTSGNIPGALYPEAIGDALKALENRIKLENGEQGPESKQQDDNYVSLSKKALPLIELMQSALEQNENLLWDNE